MKREIKLIVGLAILFFLVYPLYQSVLNLEKQISAKSAEFRQLTNYKQALQEKLDSLKREKNFEKLEAMIPEGSKEAETLNSIFQTAAENGVLIGNFSFSAQKDASSEIKRTAFTLECSGDYAALKNFLLKLQTLERVPLFSSLKISKEENTLKATVTFSTLSF